MFTKEKVEKFWKDERYIKKKDVIKLIDDVLPDYFIIKCPKCKEESSDTNKFIKEELKTKINQR
jgi:phage FluMu protein Com